MVTGRGGSERKAWTWVQKGAGPAGVASAHGFQLWIMLFSSPEMPL